ncbi:DNA repair protein RadC [Lacticaseibacillus pabuli]|uniref:DNA repair protein RadC n=1 Tax=Lacticaseibacillus pabuli TaxID=3025672 RepID=A0ABY7WNC9_9LACO|nr:DNA repair protein RadC [Lacticaseibacillus sp. KACC 23028]WDF81689.1 DNA repair protein RadC [Lacticaseibacillus sp. KACC 23028]
MTSQIETNAHWQATAARATPGELLAELLMVNKLYSPAASRSLLTRFPQLEGLALADTATLAALPHVGSQRATLITAALAFATCTLQQTTVAHDQVFSSEQIGQHLSQRYAGIKQEQLIVFYLNVKNRIISEEVVAMGTIESSAVDLRVILRRALLLGASRLVLSHNHPSGDCAPSSQDESLTESLRVSSQMIGVELLDHLVVGGNDYVSFREKGLL